MIDVDVWVRGRQDATTQRVMGIAADASEWTDKDVKKLLEGMLLAVQRTNDPASEPPPITLRGFSWIVIDEHELTEMISRVLGGPRVSTLIH